MEGLKTFDAYAKTLDDFRVKTNTGAVLSITSFVCIFLLLVSEFVDYRAVHRNSELVVDKTRRDRLQINLNVTFHKIPCHRKQLIYLGCLLKT